MQSLTEAHGSFCRMEVGRERKRGWGRGGGGGGGGQAEGANMSFKGTVNMARCPMGLTKSGENWWEDKAAMTWLGRGCRFMRSARHPCFGEQSPPLT